MLWCIGAIEAHQGDDETEPSGARRYHLSPSLILEMIWYYQIGVNTIDKVYKQK